jgi:hypothetical protein
VISLKHTHRPLYRGGIRLGQAVTPALPSPAPLVPPSVTKPVTVLTGLALTGLSAATAYVGINYGMNKKNTDLQRAVGWTVGVIGVMSGLVRLAGTAILALMPSESTA